MYRTFFPDAQTEEKHCIRCQNAMSLQVAYQEGKIDWLPEDDQGLGVYCTLHREMQNPTDTCADFTRWGDEPERTYTLNQQAPQQQPVPQVQGKPQGITVSEEELFSIPPAEREAFLRRAGQLPPKAPPPQQPVQQPIQQPVYQQPIQQPGQAPAYQPIPPAGKPPKAPKPPKEKRPLFGAKPAPGQKDQPDSLQKILGFGGFAGIIVGIILFVMKGGSMGAAICTASFVLVCAAVLAQYVRVLLDLLLAAALFFGAYKLGMVVYTWFG